jgi:RNA polymerase sigma factor (sigma-70 family)
VTAPHPAAPKSEPLTPGLGADLERLRSGLLIIALRALGDMDAAEDAVQETMARAVIAIDTGRFDDPLKLAAYVAGIARHVCSHINRDRKTTIPLEGDGDATTPAHPALSISSDPLERIISAAEAQRLHVAFSALSIDDQKLLRLCFHEERSPAEVAAALAEPAERVRKRKSRALDRLRRAFLGAESHDLTPEGTVEMTPNVSNPTDPDGR